MSMEDDLLPIEKKFIHFEQKETRVRISNFRITKTNLIYLETCSETFKMSRSQFLEKMIIKTILFIPDETFFWTKNKPRRRAKYKKSIKYKRAPNLQLNPSILNIVHRIKAKKKITFTLLFDEIFYLYIKKHPL